MSKTVIGYKFLTKEHKSKNGDTKWVLNRWQHHEGAIKLCESGFHACLKPAEAFNYAYGDVLCVVEAKGNIIHEDGDKFVAQSMRVIRFFSPEDTKAIAVEYAIKVSWRVLKHFEKEFTDDKRPRQAIQAAKKVLKDPSPENVSAARSAARCAAESAWSAWSAGSAARCAAESAGWSAESAGWSAARSARSAARCAAESAGWSAGWSAGSAGSAEKKWQEKTLQRIIDKKLKECES